MNNSEVNQTIKKDIRSLSLENMYQVMEDLGEKSFRARQLYEWIWNKSVTSFDEMTNLSKPLRDILQSSYDFHQLTEINRQDSNDGTIKLGFRLYDDNQVEGVLIPADNRMTACISSQVGCSLSCKFCATGFLDRQRNLEPGEIYDQVIHIRGLAMDIYNKSLTNIVLMGMGEPLLNYNNVLQAIEYIASPGGLGMSPRRITLSTAGIAKMIKKLGDDQAKFKLALSLHAANEKKRSQIMPINETNTLEALSEALDYYYQKTGLPVTFEYIVFRNFNDSLQDAEELYMFARKVPSKINLIEYNPVSQTEFSFTTMKKLEAFRKFLEAKNMNIRLRLSRGKDIDAACGQLANKGKL